MGGDAGAAFRSRRERLACGTKTWQRALRVGLRPCHAGPRSWGHDFLPCRSLIEGRSIKREQLGERFAALEQRIDAVDTRLTRYEETVGPQLKTLGSLLHQALSKRDRASHSG